MATKDTMMASEDIPRPPLATIAGAVRPFALGPGRGRLHPQRTLDYWVLGVVTTGTLHLAIGGVPSRLGPGDYYLLPPGIMHCGTGRTPFTVDWVDFTTASAGGRDITLPRSGCAPAWLDLPRWQAVLQRAVAHGTPVADLAPQMTSLLWALAESSPVATTDAAARLAEDLLDHLREHLGDPFDRRKLERRFGYSYRHLARVFTARFAEGPARRLARLRIEAVKAGLSMGEPPKRIAERCGYPDRFTMTRAFSKAVGQPPVRWCRRRQEAGMREPR